MKIRINHKKINQNKKQIFSALLAALLITSSLGALIFTTMPVGAVAICPCLDPMINTDSDDQIISILDESSRNLSDVLNEYEEGTDLSTVDINDPDDIEYWQFTSCMDAVKIQFEYVGKEAGSENIFGYYNHTGSTPELIELMSTNDYNPGERSEEILIINPSYNGIGVGIHTIPTDSNYETNYYAESSQNNQGEDHALIYDLGMNENLMKSYLICLEDYPRDHHWGSDFDDMVVIMHVIDCNPEEAYRTLTLNTNGQGSAEANPAGNTYLLGTEVQLTATSDPNWNFIGWTDDLTSNQNPVSIIMNEDKTITANFEEDTQIIDYCQHASKVIEYNPGTQKDGNDVSLDRQDTDNALGIPEMDDSLNFVSLGFNGNITLKFDQLIMDGDDWDFEIVETTYNHQECGNYPETIQVYASMDNITWEYIGETCLDNYAPNAEENQGRFDLNGILPWAQYIRILDISNKSDFSRPQDDGYDVDGVNVRYCALPYTLDVLIEPTGTGSVTKDPDYPIYAAGTDVTLQAIPNPEMQFNMWKNDLSGSTNPETITMNENKTVTANFTEEDTPYIEYCSNGTWIEYFNQGLRKDTNEVLESRSNATLALGDPENSDIEAEVINFVSLGFGGTLTLGFDDRIANEEGSDFVLYETSWERNNQPQTCESWPEKVNVSVSIDNQTWYEFDQICLDEQGNAFFDLSDLEEPLDCITYVRLTDTSNPADFNGNADGYDVDGIGVIHCCPDDIPYYDYCSNGTWIEDFNQGPKDNGNPVDAQRSNPDHALGIPEDTDQPPINFVSLGFGGSLIIGFNPLIGNGPGDDFRVVETSFGNPDCNGWPEHVIVSVSQDNNTYIELGEVCLDENAFFDLEGTGLDWVRYVKLVDNTSTDDFSGNADGYDVDGIGVFNCYEDVPIEDKTITLNATKIICPCETCLPNWGDESNQPTKLTESLIQDYLNDHPECSINETWEFEWALANENNPGNHLEYGGSNWNTFSGTQTITLPGDTNKIWIREAFQSGYLLFAGNTPNNNESAELYAHKDIYKYDNYDFIQPIEDGETYQIVAFNAPLCDETPNLIQNGGFEQPIVDHNKQWNIYVDGTENLEWHVEWLNPENEIPANIEIHAGVNGWQPAEGNQYAELDSDFDGPDGNMNGESASTVIFQMINTCPGRYYNLSFAFSPRPGRTAEDNNLTAVAFNAENEDGPGTPLGIKEISKDGTGLQNTDWEQYHVEFMAESLQTIVAFVDNGTSNSFGTFLDNVSLHAICDPEETPGDDDDDDDDVPPGDDDDDDDDVPPGDDDDDDVDCSDNNPPLTPHSPTPSDGSTLYSDHATLSYQVGDPDSGDSVTYEKYFGTSNPPEYFGETTRPAETTGLITNFGPITPGITYYWQIVAIDECGEIAEGPIWSITAADSGDDDDDDVIGDDDDDNNYDQDGDGVPDNEDCNPTNPDRWRIGYYYYDSDGDGYYGDGPNRLPNGTIALCYGSELIEGYTETTLGMDCDDTNANVYPGAPELCDEIDNDCDGIIDEDCQNPIGDDDDDSTGDDDDDDSQPTKKSSTKRSSSSSNKPKNNPPEANIAEPHKYTVYDQPITLDGSNSHDPDENDYITSYEWNLGDGTRKTGETITHQYDTAGAYYVTLTVQDQHGAKGSMSTKIYIEQPNRAPEKPLIGGILEVPGKETYSFAASSTDPDGDDIKYTFNWGDDTTESSEFLNLPKGSAYNMLHAWDESGEYTLTVTVSDGELTSSSEVQIQVTPVPIDPVLVYGLLAAVFAASFIAIFLLLKRRSIKPSKQ
mgnify:CR=1 FL=1